MWGDRGLLYQYRFILKGIESPPPWGGGLGPPPLLFHPQRNWKIIARIKGVQQWQMFHPQRNWKHTTPNVVLNTCLTLVSSSKELKDQKPYRSSLIDLLYPVSSSKELKANRWGKPNTIRGISVSSSKELKVYYPHEDSFLCWISNVSSSKELKVYSKLVDSGLYYGFILKGIERSSKQRNLLSYLL